MSFWNRAWCRHWMKKVHSPLFISHLHSSSSILSLLKCPCFLERLISGWSFRASSTTETVWSLRPLTSPFCPPFLNKMACFKNVNSDVSRTHGGRLYNLGRTPEQFTLWLRTTILQENGLKVTLVATFFTIFKKLSAVLTALLLYPANLWIYRGSKFVLFWNYFIL